MHQIMPNRQGHGHSFGHGVGGMPEMHEFPPHLGPAVLQQTQGPNTGMFHAPVAISANLGTNAGSQVSSQAGGSAAIGSREQLEELFGPFPCVRLRGMPFEATLDDIIRFFQGIPILDAIINVRTDGRGIGEALVLFTNPVDLNLALGRDKQHMGRRYIEVFQAKRIDYYHAIAGHLSSDGRMSGGMHPPLGYRTSAGPPAMVHSSPQHGGSFQGSQHMHSTHSVGAYSQGVSHYQGQGTLAIPTSIADPLHTGVIRMRGLPFSATKEDVLHFFQGLDVLEDSIKFVVRSDGRVSGEAFVTLGISDIDEALSRNGQHIGNRYVELFPSGIEEAARNTSRHFG